MQVFQSSGHPEFSLINNVVDVHSSAVSYMLLAVTIQLTFHCIVYVRVQIKLLL